MRTPHAGLEIAAQNDRGIRQPSRQGDRSGKTGAEGLELGSDMSGDTRVEFLADEPPCVL
jgi:hypothetical protein